MRRPARQFRLLTLRSKLRQAAARTEVSRSGLVLCSGAILPLGSHHSSDSFENVAISAGSTVEAALGDAVAPGDALEKLAGFCCMAMGGAPLLSRSNGVAEFQRRGNHLD